MPRPHKHRLIIAIDGPAGSGKSTIGDMLAERLGYMHLSTGSIYRAIGWKAQAQGIQLTDIPSMLRLIEQTAISFQRKADQTLTILVDGKDVSDALTSNDVGMLASAVAAIPEVRQGLLALQRRARQDGGVILDGRDIGTVVFPDADVKFYLDASPEERAKRRFLQLQQQGLPANLDQLLVDLKQRDHDDSTRPVAPLRKAEDAIVIDSTSLPPEEIIEIMLTTIRKITALH